MVLRRINIFLIMLFACSMHGGTQPGEERRINDLSLVESVAKYLKDLESANFYIQQYYRIKSPRMLDNAKIKFAHAKRVLEHIARMAIVEHSLEEIAAYQQYAAQFLNGLPLAELIPNLHQRREDLKPVYQKAEAESDKQKKKEIQLQVVSPTSNKAPKTEGKKTVTFAPGTKSE